MFVKKKRKFKPYMLASLVGHIHFLEKKNQRGKKFPSVNALNMVMKFTSHIPHIINIFKKLRTQIF